MRRGLHTKLVLILLLLIISLMTVVGAFLIRGVQNFYLDSFYDQMADVFSSSSLADSLYAAAGEEDAPEKLETVLSAYAGALGIDSDTRNYYILEGDTARVLLTSAAHDAPLEITANILTAMDGTEGYLSDSSAAAMDVAIPVGNYILYIQDSKETVQDLSMELFLIIIEALLVGLVISILLSFLLSKTMVNPLQSLTRAAERVSQGDFSESIQVQTRDEIGILTHTFNNMSTQLHDTLEDIENERNKLSTVFLHMTDGVAAFSPGGEIIHSNPAAERLLGRDLSHGVDFDALFGKLATRESLLSLKSPEYAEFEYSTGGLELEVSIAPFAAEGAAQGGLLAVIHDVTQQKRSDQLRREFVANVSHELRTPITSVRSYAETLVDAGPDIPPETQRQFLGVIVKESDRMTKIVQDLLTLSRFDAGTTEFNFAPFPFADSVRNVYDTMVMEAKRQELQLTLDCPETLPEIFGDKARIEQVLLNILSNAVRYTPAGGSVAVSAGAEGGVVWMRVSDTGIGIPEQDLPRIFDRFYRVDKARSRASGGTGLGLSIAGDIVRRHRGRIDVQSKLDHGTTMTILLPVDGTTEVPSV